MNIKRFGIAALVLTMASGAWAASPYAGTYRGTFHVEGAGKVAEGEIPDQDGSLEIKIAEDGKVSGTSDNLQLKSKATVEGKITDDGELTVTIKYPDQEPSTVSGIVTNPKDGRMKGDLKQKLGKATVIVSIDLKK
jgi:hypothetical protein